MRDGPCCARCGAEVHDFTRLPAEPYAYLLGLYLGDGFIAKHPRGVFRLRITLDTRYGGIIASCAQAMQHVLPANRVHVQKRKDEDAVEVGSFSKQWPCLFPQHGPGLKHRRKIELVAWQRKIVDDNTEDFLRGLVHSDGCRSMNVIRYRDKTYSYPRYNFTNASDDIRGLSAKRAIGWESSGGA